MTFSGWPEEAVDFYDGLEEDNSRTYWLDHKPIYDQAVKAPMEALLAELADEFGEGKIFRPYKDVRFSKDKTPYKDHQGATGHSRQVCRPLRRSSSMRGWSLG